VYLLKKTNSPEKRVAVGRLFGDVERKSSADKTPFAKREKKLRWKGRNR